MKLKVLNREELDIQKWDKCIDEAHNGLVYAYSWYLDITANKNWEAVVSGDYKFIMPIAVKTKYFISFIYQPFFTQQLGIFSKEEITENIVLLFLEVLKKKYKYINTNINFANKNFGQTERVNFELNLNNSYEQLYANFSKNTKIYIKKALKENLSISNNTTTEEIIQLKKDKIEINLDNNSLSLLQKLIDKCVEYKCYEIYSVRNSKDELISVFFFIFSHNRAYYILAESNNEGRKKFAAFMMMNQFIKDYSGKKLILDFEGSMIPGVSRFFRGWGAKNKPYYNFKLNRLPLLLKLFKK